jgi:phospholipid/cholesterol/gamma-HCH transport system substrate-binding protein
LERDAKYAAVGLFALLAVAAAVLFVWWYSGRGDHRDYANYEIYFRGSVSGLARASPVRYLCVDVGRVESLSVDRRNPGQVKVVAEIDSTAPISGATRARLGLLGLTGLLYIDLQLDYGRGAARQPLLKGEQYPIIISRKGDIEAFVESLPELVARAGDVLDRLQRVLGDDNLRSVGNMLANLHEASADLPEAIGQAKALVTDLRRAAAETTALAASLQQTVDRSQPELLAALASARGASDKLAKTADSLDRIVAGNKPTLKQFSGSGVAELQQLVIDARDASAEVRALARELRENPSAILREPRESGVEIAP